MSRNSHGVILLFWMGERLIVTFGRQVYCQILDHLISHSFLHGCGCLFFSFVNIMHSAGTEWWGFLFRACSSTCVALFDVSHCEWLEADSPRPPVVLWEQALVHWISLQAFACLFLPKLPHTLCLCWGLFSPLIFEAVEGAPSLLYINKDLFSSRICMQPQLTLIPV